MLTQAARCLKAILVDLDAWHKDQKKYEREGLGKVDGADGNGESVLPGMLYKPTAGNEFRPMAWSGLRTYVYKLHAGLFKVSLHDLCAKAASSFMPRKLIITTA